MLNFLPIGTNLSLKSPEGPVLDGITVTRHSARGMRFSVAIGADRPARYDIPEGHLLGYFNKYVMAWHSGKGFWDSLHGLLSVKDGPYAGLTLKEVKIAGPERDQSQAFPLDWGIPQGASFHVQYPGDAPQSEPCNFFATGMDDAGFMPAGEGRLWSAEKLVATYCERFGLPKGRDPFSVIIWRAFDYEGLSLRASKARLEDGLEARRRAALHLGTPKPAVPPPEEEEGNEEEDLAHWKAAARERAKAKAIARYNVAWARAHGEVEVERKALAEELEARKATPAPAPEPAKPSVAAAKALIEAKESALLQELAALEDLKTAQERIKTLESRIAGLKSELNIE